MVKENLKNYTMLKTKLPASITSVPEAMLFLEELHSNNEHYHPEDDATQIDWATCEPTLAECIQLNQLIYGIYDLPCNEGKKGNELAFDPCEFLIYLDKKDTVYLLDGEPRTLQYIAETFSLPCNNGTLTEIMDLQEDEDLLLPESYGFTCVKLAQPCLQQ